MRPDKINLEITDLEDACQQILDQYPEKVAAYKAGQQAHIGFFIATLIQRTNGQADHRDSITKFRRLLG